jgi:hypothetical protein
VSEFAKWDNFYVIVGSAAGALIGLQFVVLTLIAERPPEGVVEAGAAFGSPTVVHFGSVLFLSALLHAPWQTVSLPAAIWGFTGLGGIGYTLIVVRRMQRQVAYQPQFEDWLCHVALPLAAYAILAWAWWEAQTRTREALFGVGGAALLLLFVGIHNAWDNTAYHVMVNIPKGNRRENTSGADKGKPNF